MAEYYPLLAKAVAGLPEPTQEARNAVYARARNALINQLRNIQPPIAEADIERETQALAHAAARLESELKGRSLAGAASRPEPSRPPSSPASPLTARRPEPARPAASATPPSLSASRPGTPTVPSPSRTLSPSPAPPQSAPQPAARRIGMPETRTAQAQPGPVSHGAVRVAPPVAKPAQRVPPAAAPLSPQLPPPEAPEPDYEAYAYEPEDGSANEVHAEPDAALSLRVRPEMTRPYAPQPAAAEDQPYMRRRLWLVAAVVASFVVLIAVAAWMLRNRPEDLERLKPSSQTQSELSGGKIVERIGGAQTQDTSRTAAPSTSTARARDDAAPLPVAQRAALLVEAPEEQARVKTYVGTVVWRLDNVSNGSGQPLSTAVRADVDIPEAKLKAAIKFQKNFDASLSASHTITIIFQPAPDSPIGPVKEIRVPQLRAVDSQTGEGLNGIPVPIMENSFLIGLSRGPAEPANLELIRRREWFDIPMILQSNGRIAKLTFEKNTTGTRAIEEAIASWQAQ